MSEKSPTRPIKVSPENSLGSKFPEIAREASGWNPSEVSPFSNKKLLWRCESGHEWTSIVGNRVKGNGCPYCAGRLPIVGLTDLITTHPFIAKQLKSPDPSKVTAGSNRIGMWKCNNGHETKKKIIGYAKTGCNKCNPSTRDVHVGLNDLATTHPELAKQAYKWSPVEYRAGSGVKKEWICEKSHVWKVAISKRTSKDGRNCPICSNQKVLVGYNDLKTLFPEVASMAEGWDPASVIPGSAKIANWRCQKGHIFKSPINRLTRGGGCSVCANKTVMTGVNDLKTTHPEIAKQAYNWDPSSSTAGSHLKKSWICEFGHIWKTPIKTRLVSGCPYCANRRVSKGFNDLMTKFPEIAHEANGWEPSEFVFGSTKKKSWKCKKGHKWQATIKNRTQHGEGCPSCAESGFDPQLQGWLYLLEHEIWGLQQIGITNYPEQRLQTHRRLGWELLDLRGPMQGELVAIWEKAILKHIKMQGGRFPKPNDFGKFTGFTESWEKTSYSVKSIYRLMEQTGEL